MADEKQLCTFYLDDYCFGIDVLKVQEVFRYQEITSVPLVAEDVTGLINLRGQVITAINLRLRLGMKSWAEGQVPMNVVARTDDDVVCLLVDRIGDVMEISEEHYEPAPDTVQGAMRDLVTGVYKLQDRLLLILDTKKVVQFEAVAA